MRTAWVMSVFATPATGATESAALKADPERAKAQRPPVDTLLPAKTHLEATRAPALRGLLPPMKDLHFTETATARPNCACAIPYLFRISISAKERVSPLRI